MRYSFYDIARSRCVGAISYGVVRSRSNEAVRRVISMNHRKCKNMEEIIRIKKLDEAARIPTYGSAGAAGADLYALLDKELTIGPGKTEMVHTGLQMEIPEGYAGLVYARSGLASKRHLAPANKVGVIDADYRGEIIVALHNHGEEPQTIAPGERIAQIVITPFLRGIFTEASELEETSRGEGGFGSTGRG